MIFNEVLENSLLTFTCQIPQILTFGTPITFSQGSEIQEGSLTKPFIFKTVKTFHWKATIGENDTNQ